MNPSRHEVEREERKDREKAFHESLTTASLGGCGRAVDAVQQLGSGDRRNAYRLVGVPRKHGVEVEPVAFDGDEDGRIDQRPHGDLGKRACPRVAWRTSEPKSASVSGRSRSIETSSLRVRRADGAAGLMRHTASPPLSTTNSSPR